MVSEVYCSRSKPKKFESPHPFVFGQLPANKMNDSNFLDDGMNGRVYMTSRGVVKIQKHKSLGHDVMTQKRLHHLAERIISENQFKILSTPHVYLDNLDKYEMDRIDTSRIIYPGDPNHGHPIDPELFETLSQELAIFWKIMFGSGFAAWDYELYLQPDGRVMLIDFDKFGFRMTSGPVSISMPNVMRGSRSLLCVPDLRFFFQNPCFPHDFVDRLTALGFEPPADCLPTRKNED